MNDYFPSGQSKFGAFDQKASVAPSPEEPLTKGDRYDPSIGGPIARPAAVVGAVLQSDGSVALTWRRTPYNDPPGFTVTFITATQFDAYCWLSHPQDRLAMIYLLWLRESIAADQGAIMRDLDAICARRAHVPLAEPARRYLDQLGRVYPLMMGQFSPNPLVTDRGSVVQIDWPAYQATRTVHRDFLKHYCTLDDVGRTRWVADLFGVPLPVPGEDVRAAVREEIAAQLDDFTRRRDAELVAIRQQLDRLCYGRATPVVPAPLPPNYGNPPVKSAGQVAPTTTTAAGLPDWAKYLIGGVVGIGAGWGVCALLSADPRPNYRRR